MDKSDYTCKLLKLIEENGFIGMMKDITESENRKLNKLLMEFERKGELLRSHRFSLVVKAPRCPILFGQPKIHKAGVPLRPIISCVDSPTYFVAKDFARILRPLHGNTESDVRNSGDICNFLHELDMPPDYVFASFDVVNLFGCVPAEEAADLAIKRLQVDRTLSQRTNLSVDSISKLLRLCVKSNYCVCNGNYFRLDTCPMGSPLSPALVSIFMEDFEDDILKNSAQIKMWKRYVDDTLVLIKSGEEDNLLNQLNNIHDNIQFTCEKEMDGEIAFLDLKIKRSAEGINTTVYRKETATDHYLKFSSSHCSSVKWGLVSCLKKRAERICKEESDLSNELNHIRTVFARDGYPLKTLNRQLCKVQNSEKETGEDKKKLIVPYVPGLSEKLKNTVEKHGINIRFSKGVSLGSMLTNTKLDKVPELETGGVIYRQQCEDCNRVYIGESSRRAIIRQKEHEKDVREMNMRSAIAEHCHKEDHRINFENFMIIGKEKNWTRRRIREGIEIDRHDTFNRDDGLKIDKRWKLFL